MINKSKIRNLITKSSFPILFSLLFLILILPFINVIPHRDGNIDFVQTNDFIKGGINMYLNNWGSVHPPLKILASSALIKLIPALPFSYNVLGLFFGVLGIFGIYYLCLNIFTKRVAIISSSLLAISPLFLANSIFSVRDYMLTVLIIISLFFYSKHRLLLYAFFASLSVLTKETGLMFIFTVLLIEIIFVIKKVLKKDFKSILNLIYYLTPLVPWYAWTEFLSFNNKNIWSDYVFSNTKGGPLLVVLNNVLFLNIFTQYAQQHWRQLFILNFNWILWIFITISIFIFLFKRFSITTLLKNLKQDDVKIKTQLILILFFFFYLFSTLTFPTYTIPRYALPLIPIFIISIALAITSFKKRALMILLLVSTYSIFIASLFFSIDPLSKALWGVRQIDGQEMYSLDRTIAGNDGITYNYQYLLMTQKRTALIESIEKKGNSYLNKRDCDFIFPDPNNDLKTFKSLNIKLSDFKICL